jgi:single-strand DNA-binding protein
MQDINTFKIRGNVGAEPIAFGKIAKISVCTSRSWKNDKEEVVEAKDWNNLTILNEKTAAWVMANIKKGDRIDAQGRISPSSYDKDGIKVYTTELVVTNLEIMVKPAKKEASAKAKKAKAA